MTEEKRTESDLAVELRELGKQLGQALRSAWESEQRQQLEKEIGEGLKDLGKQVDQAMATAKASPHTEKVKKQVDRVVETARQSEAVHEMREGLTSGLRELNEELRKLVEKIQQKQSPSAGEPPAAPAHEDVQTSPD
jgi:heparin binding hemagglutinin HbhA